MSDTVEKWETRRFLHFFGDCHKNLKSRRFAFILGAGASAQSGIPAGRKLIDQWLPEINKWGPNHSDDITIESWATEENLDIVGFEYSRREEFYPKVFEKRFGNDPDRGRQALADILKDKEPSFGYSVLTKIITETRHDLVITTNFDDLMEKAAFIFSHQNLFIVRHESLAGYIRPEEGWPVVAKLHRDPYTAPKSTDEDTCTMEEEWEKALSELLSKYTPIVIGYAGNDGSLMDFLINLEPESIAQGIYWCYRPKKDKQLPSARIQDVVKRHGGALVPIVGFDEFMFQLNNELEFPLLLDEDVIKKQAEKRAKRYREQVEKLTKKMSDEEDFKVAIEETFKREKDWLAWALKARQEKDPVKAEQIYRQGLIQFPCSAELLMDFATLMALTLKDYHEADKLYKKGLELEPNNVELLRSYGVFLYARKGEYKSGEKVYKQAIELEPGDSNILGSFAWVKGEFQREFFEAEKLFKTALEIDPYNATNCSNFAEVLLIQNRIDEAKLYSDKAWIFNNDEINVLSIAIALTKGIIAIVENHDDTHALGKMKFLMTHERVEGYRYFSNLINYANEHMSDDDYNLYSALVVATVDESKVNELENFDRWKEIEPIPIDEPWPEGY